MTPGSPESMLGTKSQSTTPPQDHASDSCMPLKATRCIVNSRLADTHPVIILKAVSFWEYSATCGDQLNVS
ncbi:hypothetical protein FOZ62_021317 [Perkinsus olseni]|uniref:Uncharacterized protein n=1 Tax=Perkinsus olseni TaxID=32597 RepID=A0A7J6NR25_PEROL|nr:hypothetical protein FOZ62_021317 [Perkinsus olseni]